MRRSLLFMLLYSVPWWRRFRNKALDGIAFVNIPVLGWKCRLERNVISNGAGQNQWRCPQGSLKVNIDAALFLNLWHIGAGVVIQDDQGRFVRACARKIPECFDPYTAELIAIREGLEFARDYGFVVHLVESNALMLFMILMLERFHTSRPRVLNC
ncbi:LOW QUALITY PROTEIN: Ribonuclease H-like domain containing protein [Parasponia andersonii]|uniref:Ribonuclease H-like domain containing protein n=1 Tax=Parasponia andersonii TaxID=3476 RepID=A0A2P5AIW9_PARAD|nr:LOW QUALITY PROTEIN: Ribonuclease H-like domain containing protein [Parasponia andersonii]